MSDRQVKRLHGAKGGKAKIPKEKQNAGQAGGAMPGRPIALLSISHAISQMTILRLASACQGLFIVQEK